MLSAGFFSSCSWSFLVPGSGGRHRQGTAPGCQGGAKVKAPWSCTVSLSAYLRLWTAIVLYCMCKKIICPISVADLKIVFLSVIFKIFFFPAEGELVVLLLEKKHCTEVHWWRAHIRTALFAQDAAVLFMVFCGIKTMGCFYLHGGQTVSDRSNDQILVWVRKIS